MVPQDYHNIFFLENSIQIPKSDQQLIKECSINTFRANGRGGQHLNKTESAVRITHIPTGIITTCQDERSQYLNKKKCIKALRKKLLSLTYKKPKRIPTKKPKFAKEKILHGKKKNSIKKQSRQKPNLDDIC